MRPILYMMLGLHCAPAAAAINCDQLGNIAMATEQYRNQGESLQAILAEAEKLESGGNMTKEDMLRIRKTVQEASDRTFTSLEIRKDCKDVRAK